MITVTEYNNDKLGLILGFQDEESMLLNMTGKTYVAGEYDGGSTYILNGQPTERPASPVTLSDLTLQGVPAGSTLTIASASLSTSNGERYDAEGEVELEFPLPGTYSLRVECWPYKDWEGEVVVPVVSGVEA